jgi:predicted NBD/HSP70 family sugar kinase
MEARRGQNLLDLRDVNMAVLLSAIWERGPISRIALAEETGLAPSSITRLIRQLHAKGLIAEMGKGASKGGRQPILISPNPDAGIILSFDLSGVKLRGGLFDAANASLREIERPFEGTGPDSIRRQLFGLGRELAADPSAKGRRLLGIGVSAPAAVSGIVSVNANLGLRRFPLRDILEEEFDVPVLVQNDSQGAALAERNYGAGRGIDDFIYLLLSDGVGSGLVLGGDIYRGPLHTAGEIGHVVIERAGAFCSCGKRGCLETFASRPAILAHARQIATHDGDDALARAIGEDAGRLDLPAIREAAEAGSRGAANAIEFAADLVGFAIANTVTLLGLKSVIVGGDVVDQLGPAFFDAIGRAVKKYNGNFQTTDLYRGELDWRGLLRSTSMLTLQRIIGIAR